MAVPNIYIYINQKNFGNFFSRQFDKSLKNRLKRVKRVFLDLTTYIPKFQDKLIRASKINRLKRVKRAFEGN